MAIRLSNDRLRLVDPNTDATPTTPADDVSALASVRRITALSTAHDDGPHADAPSPTAAAGPQLSLVTANPDGEQPPGGDDDRDDDIDDTTDFYADVMESA